MISQNFTKFAVLLLIFVGFAPKSYAGKTFQLGKAAYYHDKFHGRKTASRELYDKAELTAAHKTLPFGTIIKVTRIDNGMSVEVRVNDRGPYKDGFIVDLSRKAAEQVDMIKAGIADVKLEVIETEVVAPKPTLSAAGDNKSAGAVPTLPELMRPASYSTPAESIRGVSSKGAKLVDDKVKALQTNPKNEEKDALYQISLQKLPKSGFAIQVGVFTTLETALDELAKVQKATSGAGLLKLDAGENGQTLYKVLLGPFPDKDVAAKERKSASRKHPKCFVVDLAE